MASGVTLAPLTGLLPRKAALAAILGEQSCDYLRHHQRSAADRSHAQVVVAVRFPGGIGRRLNFGGGGGAQVDDAGPRDSAASRESSCWSGLSPSLLIVAFVILKFLSTGALIEGVKRARRNGAMTVREGFREGWAHWGVLFRVALLYVPLSFGSVAVLAGACYLVWLSFGSPAMFVAAGVAILVGVPWLLTLYMWQAFAERIAVLENRRALDAMRKARLFLHGRLQLGLKLLVAAFLGVLARRRGGPSRDRSARSAPSAH